MYKLDDSEQTITTGQGEVKAKAKWEGVTLVVATTREGTNGPMTTRTIYSLEEGYLVITTENPRGSRKIYLKKAS